jgi:biopolymer transport protein ExbD
MAFGEFDPAPSSPPMSDINVTPLVDVMLVLLVIFIITAPLMTGALQLALPQVQAPASQTSGTAPVVTIDSHGQLMLDTQPLPVSQLAAALNLRSSDGASTEVQLRVDQTVPYGQVAEVMAEIQKSELRSVALVVQTPAPKIPASSSPQRH